MYFLKFPITRSVSYISGGHFTSETRWIHSKRCLDSFEIIIGVKGIAYIKQDEECFSVEPGSVLILLPGHVHEGSAYSEEETSFYWFHFNFTMEYSLIDNMTFETEMMLIRNNSYFDKPTEYAYLPVFFKPENIDRVNILYHQLLHTHNSKYYAKLSSKYMLLSILIELSEQSISRYEVNDRKTFDRNIYRILEWIRLHYRERISTADLAVRFNYNKDYLSRSFKQKTGLNIQQYVHILKVAKAKELLYRSDKSIKEISFYLGFSDEKYFMRIFKRCEKVTPTNYRNAYFRTHQNNS